jgi:hypothetical protein
VLLTLEAAIVGLLRMLVGMDLLFLAGIIPSRPLYSEIFSPIQISMQQAFKGPSIFFIIITSVQRVLFFTIPLSP